MYLDSKTQHILASALRVKQEELANVERFAAQAEIYSNTLIYERLLVPAGEIISRFEAALGFPLPISELVFTTDNHLIFDFDCFIDTETQIEAELETIFDILLTVADDRSYLSTTQLSRLQTWSLGNIKLRLFISCPVPESQLAFLKSIGKINTEVETKSYETISCSVY